MIEADQIPSMIFWGPPGVGKTTLAGIIAGKTHARFINFSAVTSGIKEIKEVMAQAEGTAAGWARRRCSSWTRSTAFNKAQQDAFLPYVEKGSIILIGATTENPSFEINNALLSRCRVFVLESLKAEDICQLLKRALKSPDGLGYLKVEITDEMLEMIAGFSEGDARKAFNLLEMAVSNGQIEGDKTTVTMDVLKRCLGKKSLLYDKKGEEHYNLISALHKSMRNSDPDAAVYWLARMLEAGEDPLYVARTADPLCQRGCRHGGQPGPAFGGGGLPGLPFSGDAGVQCEFKPCGDLSVPWLPSPTPLMWLTRRQRRTPRTCWRSRSP